MKTPVYVIDILRTPVGKFGGTLAAIRPDDLAAHVIQSILARNPNIDPAAIDEVILGAANQAGEDNRNVARMASLMAGIPTSVPGYTVNRLCASGLQSIMNGAMSIASGQAHLVVAGGTESMTRAPFVMAKADAAFSRTPEIYDTTIGWRFTNKTLAKMYHPFIVSLYFAFQSSLFWSSFLLFLGQKEWFHFSRSWTGSFLLYLACLAWYCFLRGSEPITRVLPTTSTCYGQCRSTCWLHSASTGLNNG